MALTYEQLVEHAQLITPVRRLVGHSAAIFGVAFSPNGHWLATGAYDGSVRLWEVRTGQEIRRWKSSDGVYSVVFSPDGRQLAAGAYNRSIRVWEIESGEKVRQMKGHTGPVWSVAFSPDGQWLASASSDHTVRLWDAQGRQRAHHLVGHTFIVDSVAFAPDGCWLASASDDYSVRLWDPHSRECRLVYSGHSNAVTWVEFSPDGTRCASSGADHSLRVWVPGANAAEWEILDESTLTVCRWSPDGRILATYMNGKAAPRRLALWSATDGRLIWQRAKTDADTWWTTRALAFDPRGSLLATYPPDNLNEIELLDISALECREQAKFL